MVPGIDKTRLHARQTPSLTACIISPVYDKLLLIKKLWGIPSGSQGPLGYPVVPGSSPSPLCGSQARLTSELFLAVMLMLLVQFLLVFFLKTRANETPNIVPESN